MKAIFLSFIPRPSSSLLSLPLKVETNLSEVLLRWGRPLRRRRGVSWGYHSKLYGESRSVPPRKKDEEGGESQKVWNCRSSQETQEEGRERRYPRGGIKFDNGNHLSLFSPFSTDATFSTSSLPKGKKNLFFFWLSLLPRLRHPLGWLCTALYLRRRGANC